MGLFSIFQKSAEDIEEAGDRCYSEGDFGSAKIEYDRALARAEKKSPEKAALIERIGDKCRKAREALARSHLENARELMATGEHDAEASELLILALELTGDEALQKDVEELRRDIFGSRASMSEPAFSPESGRYIAEDPFSGNDADDDDQGDEEEYFNILCSTLPDEVQDAYHEFGPAFKEGYLALNQGDFETAADRLAEAMEQDADPGGLIPPELATALANLGRYETVRRLMEPYVRHHPESVRGYQILCDVYWEQRSYDQALTLLDQCPESIRPSIQIQLLMGETMYLRGDYPSAIRLFSAWLDANGYQEIMARSLAKTLEADGRIAAARDLYAQIIRGCASCGSRTDPFTRRRYAELCYQSGDRSQKLLDLFLSLAQEDPDSKKEYYLRIQQLYEQKGDIREARRFQAMADAVEARGG